MDESHSSPAQGFLIGRSCSVMEVSHRRWHWIIGNTNLQYLIARLEALLLLCQFVSPRLWSGAQENAVSLLHLAGA
ncbi:hypothetical protein K5D32_23480 [Pseudomonas cichorii]|uniref:hypothetical protein n=1 Tax=Pseudomonas cichorii TaxID=36746 RepID=UPI001C8A9E66|nr:hypothetical protein [Pseudomonas cichorii]MBX8532635.1 hypothetical protein [Pseudomonas cichorii]